MDFFVRVDIDMSSGRLNASVCRRIGLGVVFRCLQSIVGELL